MNLSEKTLEKIKNEKISNKPKWIFKLQDIALFLSFLFFIIIAIFSFTLILNTILNLEIDFYFKDGFNFVEYLLNSLPFTTLLISLVSLFIAYKELKSTERYYRINDLLIFGLLFFFTIITGIVLIFLGFGKITDDFFKFNLNTSIIDQTPNRFWNNPEIGFIFGKIVENRSKDFLIIEDTSGFLWKVILPDLIDLSNIKIGEIVRIYGVKNGDNEFFLREIRLYR